VWRGEKGKKLAAKNAKQIDWNRKRNANENDSNDWLADWLTDWWIDGRMDKIWWLMEMMVVSLLSCWNVTKKGDFDCPRSRLTFNLVHEKHFSPEFNLIARLMSVRMNKTDKWSNGQTNECHSPSAVFWRMQLRNGLQCKFVQRLQLLFSLLSHRKCIWHYLLAVARRRLPPPFKSNIASHRAESGGIGLNGIELNARTSHPQHPPLFRPLDALPVHWKAVGVHLEHIFNKYLLRGPQKS